MRMRNREKVYAKENEVRKSETMRDRRAEGASKNSFSSIVLPEGPQLELKSLRPIPCAR